MKITRKFINSGNKIKRYESPKKSKGGKKPCEKSVKDSNSSDSQEKLVKQSVVKHSEKKIVVKKAIEVEKSLPDEDVVEVKNDLKKHPLEKRKQEGNEWKALKKVDYQRLETVVEEGQLCSDETGSKPNIHDEGKRSESESEIIRLHMDLNHVKRKKPKICDLTSITETPEFHKAEDSGYREEKQQTGEKGDSAKTYPSPTPPVVTIMEEPDEKLPSFKRNINGVVEILPIFSNDNFVCSRDAISIEECEELDPLEKYTSSCGPKALVAGKSKPSNFLTKKFYDCDSRSLTDRDTFDVKPFISANNIEKKTANVHDTHDRADRSSGHKDHIERKLRYKLLTDRNLVQQTSSYFINSLLVLPPFASERDSVFSETKLGDIDTEDFCSSIQETENGVLCELKTLSAVVGTTFGLFSIILGIAWKSYKPPCMIDYLLKYIPFVHRRRTFLQLFFDEFLRLFAKIFG